MHAPVAHARVHRLLALGGGAYMFTLRCSLGESQHTARRSHD
jgi:hypothetical protein